MRKRSSLKIKIKELKKFCKNQKQKRNLRMKKFNNFMMFKCQNSEIKKKTALCIVDPVIIGYITYQFLVLLRLQKENEKIMKKFKEKEDHKNIKLSFPKVDQNSLNSIMK